MIYRSSGDADATATQIASVNSVKAAAYKCDVTDAAACDIIRRKIAEDFGRLDVVVVNAGVAAAVPAEGLYASDVFFHVGCQS